MEAISAENALLPEVNVEAIVGECYVPFPQ